MRASTVRIIVGFGLLLALAVSAHWVGPGPDPAPLMSHPGTSHHAASSPDQR